jgi:chromosome segregation ATPase
LSVFPTPKTPLSPTNGHVTNTPSQRRRAQNRASQRAFRERKEKHVQHLEHELEELENKHRTLEKSYTDLGSTHAQLKQEVKQLRSELDSVKSSREGSITESTTTQNQFFDPFASDGFFGNGNDARY